MIGEKASDMIKEDWSQNRNADTQLDDSIDENGKINMKILEEDPERDASDSNSLNWTFPSSPCYCFKLIDVSCTCWESIEANKLFIYCRQYKFSMY